MYEENLLKFINILSPGSLLQLHLNISFSTAVIPTYLKSDNEIASVDAIVYERAKK